MKKLPQWTVLLLLASGCTSPNWDLEDMPLQWPPQAPQWAANPQATPATQPFSTLPDEPTLTDCLRLAALSNPGLEASFRTWQAALQRVPQVTALPDPNIRYSWYIQEVETRVGPQEQAFGVSQMFPWFGKLELRGDVASQAAQAAYARYIEKKLKLFFEVKDVYFELAYLAHAIRITQQNRDLVKSFERVALSKYRVDGAKHVDVIRAQVELGKIQNDLASLEDRRTPIVARLNAVLNRPAAAPIGWPPKAQPLNAQPFADEQLLMWLRESNPLLKSLEARIRQRRKGVDLVKKDYYPDVTFGLDWILTGDALRATPDDGKDPVILRVAMNLPVWRGKLDASVREAMSRLVAASRQYDDQRNNLESRVKLVAYRFRDAGRQITLYRNVLVPKANQSVRASEVAYRAGKVDFLNLLDAQRLLLAFQLAHQRALATHAQRLAELESLVGKPLFKP